MATVEISSQPEPLSALRSTLGTPYRLELTDGRVLIGDFACLDHQGNLVLDRTLEIAPNQQKEEPPRELGLVLVPSRWWKTVQRRGEGEKAKEGCVPV